MSRAVAVEYRGERGFPRVSGDEPDRARAYVLPETFSPRERG